MKKLLLGLGAVASVITPITAVVACGDTKTPATTKPGGDGMGGTSGNPGKTSNHGGTTETLSNGSKKVSNPLAAITASSVITDDGDTLMSVEHTTGHIQSQIVVAHTEKLIIQLKALVVVPSHTKRIYLKEAQGTTAIHEAILGVTIDGRFAAAGRIIYKDEVVTNAQTIAENKLAFAAGARYYVVISDDKTKVFFSRMTNDHTVTYLFTVTL